MKKHSIENSPFWMTLAIDPCHSWDRDSQNRPERREGLQRHNFLWLQQSVVPGSLSKSVYRS